MDLLPVACDVDAAGNPDSLVFLDMVHLPKALSPLLHSGMLLAAIASVLLNLYFNGLKSSAEAEREAAVGASTSDLV